MHVGKLKTTPFQAQPQVGCKHVPLPSAQRVVVRKPKLTQTRSQSEDKAHSSEETWKLPIAGSDTDWRAFRARLVAGETAEPDSTNSPASEVQNLWAHAIARPERGCLVLAHPLMFKTHQQYFDQAVILLINHDESGTAGLLLNKPLQQLIGGLSGADSLRPEFDKNRLFLGGDVGGSEGGNSLQLLHNQKQFAKSTEIVDGVYIGGHEAARMAVRRDGLDPISTCRWYCRYAGWAPGQLQSEIEKGVWFTVAASKEVIFHQSACQNGSEQWHLVMQQMGGEFKQLSDAIQVDPNVNYLQRMADAEKEKDEGQGDSSGPS